MAALIERAPPINARHKPNARTAVHQISINLRAENVSVFPLIVTN